MRINTNEEIRELVVGGQSYDVSELSNEAIEQLARSLGVQADASENYEPSTQTLELTPKTGSKGSISMRELARQIDKENEEEDLKSVLSGLGVNEDEVDEDEDEVDEDEDEDEVDEDEVDEDDEFEYRETEEERQEREYLESFAIPASRFSKSNIKYFKQNDVDVTNLNELIQATMKIEEINNDYKKRKVQSLFEQYNNEELDVNQLIEEVSKLGRI